jgi:hypothetical protein
MRSKGAKVDSKHRIALLKRVIARLNRPAKYWKGWERTKMYEPIEIETTKE